ncbi:MAG: hypothetical protein J6P65_00975 [Bacteroidales bacterium]|nr:hypothetical protein [Bacteroidales bacterium]
MKKTFLFLALILPMSLYVCAQQTLYEAKQSPKTTEITIGTITKDFDAGHTEDFTGCTSCTMKPFHNDYRKKRQEDVLYEWLYEYAKKEYNTTYPNFALRNFKSSEIKKEKESRRELLGGVIIFTYYNCTASATVVTLDPKIEAIEDFHNSIEKALRNVRQGSRIAIDQVVAMDGRDREDLKDDIINVLLDKGYKVVAKEYLEKLYEEQQKQQSGIYNEKTTVQNNNFSAVGYYISVKTTKESLRVQVVNVSTGEYEGNVFNSKHKEKSFELLSQAIDKALIRIQEGSRVAIDQVTVSSDINREDYKDQMIDVLINHGYKVAAKEYLEKLYEEQKKQQSGIYNDNTTVQENNFSAVGYFVNVKVTESSVRVQVINVSTGEYEGNATINF